MRAKYITVVHQITELQKGEITDPYMVIEGAFSASSLVSYRKNIHSMIYAASKSGYWQKGSPGALLSFYDELIRLLEATYLLSLNSQKKIRKKDWENFDGNNVSAALYTGSHATSTIWDYFPRSLSKKQFIHPQIVFQSFYSVYSLPEWKFHLKEILKYALSTDSCDDIILQSDLILALKWLLKIVEAAHIILVRKLKGIDSAN